MMMEAMNYANNAIIHGKNNKYHFYFKFSFNWRF